MYYREDKKGQILEEGINEAGAFCSWLASGTSYSNHDGVQTIPFYIYYSMFGFQRIGDFIWAGGDLQARGFLIGGTAGRTTLAGEGLQHQDGHSLVAASTIPNCVSYDPTYAYELAVIVQDGLRRMMQEQENVFYYITCMNENYVHPPMPGDVKDGILKGMYQLQVGGKGKIRVQLMGSGTILREVIGAAELLASDFGVPSDVWSVTSFNELRRDCLATERWNQLHPEADPRQSYLETALAHREGPFVAATDYMKIVPDQVQRWMPGTYVTLGTDGFGRSDGRDALRRFFEVDRRYIAVTALKALADDGKIDQATVRAGNREIRYRSGEAGSGDALMAGRIDIVVPDLGDFSDVEVIEILVNAGDTVQQEDGLITLETDKATMDVPAAEGGTVEAITVAVGDTVSTGDVIGTMSIEEAPAAEAHGGLRPRLHLQSLRQRPSPRWSAVANRRSRCPISATSTTSRLSRFTSAPAIGSRPMPSWLRSRPTRPRWTCRRRRRARSGKCW